MEEERKIEIEKWFEFSRKIIVGILKYNGRRLQEYINEYDPNNIVDLNVSTTIREALVFNRIGITLKYLDYYYTKYLTSSIFRRDLHKYLTNNYTTTKRKQIKIKGNCDICCIPLDRNETHHLIPLVYGGSNEKDNLASVCSRCHELDPFEIIFSSLKKMFLENKEDLLRKFTLN